MYGCYEGTQNMFGTNAMAYLVCNFTPYKMSHTYTLWPIAVRYLNRHICFEKVHDFRRYSDMSVDTSGSENVAQPKFELGFCNAYILLTSIIFLVFQINIRSCVI